MIRMNRLTACMAGLMAVMVAQPAVSLAATDEEAQLLKAETSVAVSVSLQEAMHKVGLSLSKSERPEEILQSYVLLKESLGVAHEDTQGALKELQVKAPVLHAWVVVSEAQGVSPEWSAAMTVLKTEHPQNAWLALVETEARSLAVGEEEVSPASQNESPEKPLDPEKTVSSPASWSLIDPQHELLPLLVLSPERAFELQSLVTTHELKDLLEGVGDVRALLVLKTMNQWQAKNQLARLQCKGIEADCAQWGRALAFTDYAQASSMMGALVWKSHCQTKEDCALAQQEIQQWNHWLDFPPFHRWLVVESQALALLQGKGESGMKYWKAQLGN